MEFTQEDFINLVKPYCNEMQKYKEATSKMVVKENGEVFLYWHITVKPSPDYNDEMIFRENIEVINKLDDILYRLAQECKEKNIKYLFKIFKQKYLTGEYKMPISIDSSILVNAELKEDDRVNKLSDEEKKEIKDPIAKAEKEFELRKKFYNC